MHSDFSDNEWKTLLAEIHGLIGTFDQTYSRFRADSLVTTMSKRRGTYALPSDAMPLLEFYKKLYDATDGQVTPLIGQALSDAGYDADYSFRQQALSRPPRWEEVISYDADTITLQRPALLDFGAAGKGYLVDLVSELLEARSVSDYLVDAGGDMRRRRASDQPLPVGLENPFDTSQAVGVVRLGSQSLCASAGSRRAWGAYHHILDPTLLMSPREVSATWVLAADTLTADGLSTALFFTAPARLQDFAFSYALLNRDMSLVYSADFPVDVFEAAA